MSLIDKQQPLQPEYIPSQVVNRDEQRREVEQAFSAGILSNLLFHGPRGTGKSLIAHHTIIESGDNLQGHYIPCNRYNTQYKALRHLHASITDDETGPGYHTSRLQREIEQQTLHTKHLVVLDELDFLLLNDGNDLLYYLSRLDTSGNVGLILISSETSSLEDRVDERTYSTLQPQRLSFEPYTPEEAYEILAKRARHSLEPSSLHHNALTYITSTTTNLEHGLHWLRQAAQNQDEPITEETVRRHREDTQQAIIDTKLAGHTEHHRHLYQAIQSQTNSTLRSGQAYTAYREHCNKQDVEPLSNRRISDFLKHLDLYDIIDTTYHRGGTEGKTREIKLNTL